MLLRRRLCALAALGSAAVLSTSIVGPAAMAATKVTKATKGSKPAPKTQVVVIEMGAVKYKPQNITVKAMRPVTFKFVNTSNAAHEALIGNIDQQLEHGKEMKAAAKSGSGHSGHEGHGEHASMDASSKDYVFVKGNQTKTLTYTFTKRGRTMIGCHQPGHWESGMKLNVFVE